MVMINVFVYFLVQENERSRDIIIEQRFHRNIIVEKLPELREKFAETQISFPDPSKKTDVVNIRGPKEQSDKVYTFLKKYNTELVRSSSWDYIVSF